MTRYLLGAAACVLAAAPIAAQQPEHPQTPIGAVVRDVPRADTAAILRAATDSVSQPVSLISVVADTAWVAVMRRGAATYRRDSTAKWVGDETAVGFTQATLRVERRNGKWVRRPQP
jgi:hypothetical protein